MAFTSKCFQITQSFPQIIKVRNPPPFSPRPVLIMRKNILAVSVTKMYKTNNRTSFPAFTHLCFSFSMLLIVDRPIKHTGYIQKNLNLNEWGNGWGIKIFTTKTVGMPFHKSMTHARQQAKTQLNIGTQPIPIVKETKFLGVIFNNQLTFKQHINNTIDRCNKTLNVLRVINGTTWGADTQTMIQTYKAITLSKTYYGAQAYNSA